MYNRVGGLHPLAFAMLQIIRHLEFLLGPVNATADGDKHVLDEWETCVVLC
jgi:hypothetical protein